MNDPSTRVPGPLPADDLRAELAALRAEVAALRAEGQRREEAHARARAELQERLDQLHGIYVLSDATGRAEDLDAIYGEALRCLTRTLGADRASVLLFDERGSMRFKAYAGLSERYRQKVDGHSPWTRESRNPEPILVPDAASDESLGDLRAVLRQEGIAALGFIPLVNHGRLLGKLMIYYDRPHRFDDEQVQLAQAIAAHIAIAIDRKQREEALAGARERLRVVISASPIILFSADANGTVTLSEGRGLEQLGVAPGGLVGMSVHSLGQNNPTFHAYVARALSGETFTGLIEAGGLTFEARCAPLRDAEGRISGMIGVASDISERRRAEEALASLAAASTQLGASLDYGTTLGTVGRIFVPSQADWCAVYVFEGTRLRKVMVSHADPARQPLIEQMHQRIPPDLYPGHPVLRLLQEGRTLVLHDVGDEELRAMCLDEEHFEQLRTLGARARLCLPLHCRGRTMGAIVLNKAAPGSRFAPEEVRHAEELAWRCAMAIDNARLYHETQEAVRAREEFLSIASHEIRAPLNTLHLQVQMLLRTLRKGQLQTAEPTRTPEMLEGADRQVRRLAELIDKLFDVSRIAAGKLDLHPEEVDLAQLVRDAAGRIAEELKQAGCALTLSVPPSCPGRWDRVRLDQVVTNLLANAMKYGAGKPISISVAEGSRPGQARLVVADQGIGIAKDQQEQIFERFERAAGRSYGGLGLGLYIVRKILHAMGGTIRVDSQLGQGSTFVVELPREGSPSEISIRPSVP